MHVGIVELSGLANSPKAKELLHFDGRPTRRALESKYDSFHYVKSLTWENWFKCVEWWTGVAYIVS